MASRAERKIRSQFRQARTQLARARTDLSTQRQAARRQQESISREESRLSGQQAIRQARGPAGLIARQQAISNIQAQRVQVSAFQQQLSGVERQISQASTDLSRQESSAIRASRVPTIETGQLAGGQRVTFVGGALAGTIFSPEGIAIGTTTRELIGVPTTFVGGQSVPFSTPFGEGVDVPGFQAIGTTPSGGIIAQEIRPSVPTAPISTTAQQDQTLRERESIRLRLIREALARNDLPEAVRIASAAAIDPFTTGIQAVSDPIFETEFATAIRERAAATIPGVSQIQEFLGQPVPEEQLQLAGASIFFAPAFFQATVGQQVVRKSFSEIAREQLAGLRTRFDQIKSTAPTSQSGIVLRRDLIRRIREILKNNPNDIERLKLLFSRAGENAEIRAILNGEINRLRFAAQQITAPQVQDIPTSGLGGGFPPLGPVQARAPITEEQIFVSGRVTVPQFTVSPTGQLNILQVPTTIEGIQPRLRTAPRLTQLELLRFAQSQQFQQAFQTPQKLEIARTQALELIRTGQRITQIPRIAQIQLPGQRTLQIQFPRIPQVPRLRLGRPGVGPVLPRLPIGGDQFAATRRALVELRSGVNVIVGKGKKEKIVARNLPPNLALRTGVQRISKNITASFILRTSGRQATRSDIGRFRPGNQFRPGKRDPLRVVEKRQFRLDTPTEIAQIKSARKSKSFKRRKTKR